MITAVDLQETRFTDENVLNSEVSESIMVKNGEEHTTSKYWFHHKQTYYKYYFKHQIV